ncbi:sensor histidine kinase [Nocardiopsis sp. NPDC006938]|uniref:sensor histidine kinase n=1 Tax=Nocardiopsis sp. NPDC006938 TaxID=3364337 RepID=UPI0036C56DCD
MFGRVQHWLRRHEMLVDTISVAPFLLLCAGAILGYAGADPGHLSVPPHLVTAFALLIPLAWRRTFPVAVFTVVAVVAAVQLGLGVGLIAADFAVVVAMYTVAARCQWLWTLTALGIVEVGLLLAIARSPHADWGDWDAFATYTFLILLFWVTGLYMKVRRRYILGLEERARWLERERDTQAQTAVAEERARIAREMHDVVAHSLSVMVIQADGATYAIDDDPARAKGALETIATTGRSALAEVRGILGVLRESEEEYTPQPGIRQLDQVIGQMRGAGLPVEFTAEGQQRRLSAGVELAAYRVIQEALTNTLKHAGPGVSRVQVRVHYGADALELRILDDGWGAAAPGAAGNSRGHGLIGMRERVSVYRGSVRTGPHTGGGFEVVASLPLRPSTR